MIRFLTLTLLALFSLTSSQVRSSESLTKEPITPLSTSGPNIDPDKLSLGKKLFHDVRLSKNNSISCASCHDLNRGGADGRPRSIGINGGLGDINSPTVLNSGFNFRQFWDGRAKSLEDQVEGPIHHPKEMGTSWNEIIQKLQKDKHYPDLFKKIYKDGVTSENIKNAIASFERALITPNSRFDRFLRGESQVLTEIEKKGYQHFKSYGCIACHQGSNVGGNMFQTMGVMGNYFKDRGGPITTADLGRYNVTKDEMDKYAFRVPSLRNVELTAPYFHDGSVTTLEQAVNVMVKYQLGRKLSKAEVDAIVAFLKTLTGELPESLRQPDRKAASE